MKTLIILSVMLSVAFAQIQPNYQDATSVVVKKYSKMKQDLAKQKVDYRYNIESVNLFPFFCIKNDTMEKYLKKTTQSIYDSKLESVIRKSKDIFGFNHAQIAYLSYIQPKKGEPTIKSYSLYFLKMNADNTWNEEREAMNVKLFLTNNKETVTYDYK